MLIYSNIDREVTLYE